MKYLRFTLGLLVFWTAQVQAFGFEKTIDYAKQLQTQFQTQLFDESEFPEVAYFSLEGVPPELEISEAITLTVIPRNENGKVVRDYQGTIRFSSSDPQARLPEDYAFTQNDRGAKAFFQSIILSTPGVQTISVHDLDNYEIASEEKSILVIQSSRKEGIINILTPTPGLIKADKVTISGEAPVCKKVSITDGRIELISELEIDENDFFVYQTPKLQNGTHIFEATCSEDETIKSNKVRVQIDRLPLSMVEIEINPQEVLKPNEMFTLYISANEPLSSAYCIMDDIKMELKHSGEKFKETFLAPEIPGEYQVDCFVEDLVGNTREVYNSLVIEVKEESPSLEEQLLFLIILYLSNLFSSFISVIVFLYIILEYLDQRFKWQKLSFWGDVFWKEYKEIMHKIPRKIRFYWGILVILIFYLIFFYFISYTKATVAILTILYCIYEKKYKYSGFLWDKFGEFWHKHEKIIFKILKILFWSSWFSIWTWYIFTQITPEKLILKYGLLFLGIIGIFLVYFKNSSKIRKCLWGFFYLYFFIFLYHLFFQYYPDYETSKAFIKIFINEWLFFLGSGATIIHIIITLKSLYKAWMKKNRGVLNAFFNIYIEYIKMAIPFTFGILLILHSYALANIYITLIDFITNISHLIYSIDMEVYKLTTYYYFHVGIMQAVLLIILGYFISIALNNKKILLFCLQLFILFLLWPVPLIIVYQFIA